MIRLRPFRAGDAEALSELFFVSVHDIAGAHYSIEQVRAWAPAPPDPVLVRRRARDGRTLLVAVGPDNRPLAYGDVEADGHIDHVYCHPLYTRSDTARALYGALEDVARRGGVGRLYVEASEPARRFFERRGFSVDQRRDFTVRGVMIHNYRMEKPLS